MRPTSGLLASPLLVVSAHANVSLLPPSARWMSGETVTLEAMVPDGALPAKLEVQLTNARGFLRTLEAEQVATDGPVGRYELHIPDEVSGRLLVKLNNDARAPYVVEILARSLPPPNSATPTYGEEIDAAQPTAPPPLSFAWVDAFYTHEPLYFMLGAGSDSETKFQISFKYQIYSPKTGLPKYLADSWLAPDGLYATYTQTSLWDISAHSSPFRDTSYKPGLYWQKRDLWYREAHESRARLSLMTGVEHESNGRSGTASRSINVFVVRPTLGYVTKSEWRFMVSPKLYAYIEKTDNEDIPEYRGYMDLSATVRMPSENHDGGLQLSLIGRLGSKGGRGSIQADLTYPIRIFHVPGYLGLQVFNGYGEAIIDYNHRRETQYRLGFAAIR